MRKARSQCEQAQTNQPPTHDTLDSSPASNPPARKAHRAFYAFYALGVLFSVIGGPCKRYAVTLERQILVDTVADTRHWQRSLRPKPTETSTYLFFSSALHKEAHTSNTHITEENICNIPSNSTPLQRLLQTLRPFGSLALSPSLWHLGA